MARGWICNVEGGGALRPNMSNSNKVELVEAPMLLTCPQRERCSACEVLASLPVLYLTHVDSMLWSPVDVPIFSTTKPATVDLWTGTLVEQVGFDRMDHGEVNSSVGAVHCWVLRLHRHIANYLPPAGRAQLLDRGPFQAPPLALDTSHDALLMPEVLLNFAEVLN